MHSTITITTTTIRKHFLKKAQGAWLHQKSCQGFLLRRRYLIVVPRPLLAAPLAVRRTYLILVLRSVLRSLSVTT